MDENAATGNNQRHHLHHQVGEICAETLPQSVSECSNCSDHGGYLKRTGNLWTAIANIITTILGAGVISQPWCVAQLGWAAGLGVMLFFSIVGNYTARLLSDCYRTGDPVSGKRNFIYSDSVCSILGGAKAKACGFIQYITLFSNAISCTGGASFSMMAITFVNRLHNKEQDPCPNISNPYMIAFGITEILLSQIPDFDQIRWLSIVAAVLLAIYSLISLGLGIAHIAATGNFEDFAALNVGDGTETQDMWNFFRALGGIASAYAFHETLIEIQDTIGSPPAEAKTMKRAISLSIVVMTIIYMLCGCVGYAAFGDATPENILEAFNIAKPFWLVDIANAAIVISLVGSYQTNSQPIFAFIEKQVDQRWPHSEFIAKEIKIPVLGLGQYNMKLSRLVWSTIFVTLTTVISMLFPFVFNEIAEIILLGFWPLMVYFPIEMYIKQKKIVQWSSKWVCLQLLSVICLGISIMTTVGKIAELKDKIKNNQPFGTTYCENAWT